jgi:DNA-binding beta-propeller fold protein YncE
LCRIFPERDNPRSDVADFREAPAPPGDYEYFSTIAADPAGEKVFVEVNSGQDFGVAVIDARTEEVLKVISGVAMWAGAIFPPGGSVGYFLGRGDVIDLVSLQRIASLPMAGVAGALPDGVGAVPSPDGGYGGIIIRGYPAK